MIPSNRRNGKGRGSVPHVKKKNKKICIWLLRVKPENLTLMYEVSFGAIDSSWETLTKVRNQTCVPSLITMNNLSLCPYSWFYLSIYNSCSPNPFKQSRACALSLSLTVCAAAPDRSRLLIRLDCRLSELTANVFIITDEWKHICITE